MYGRPVETDSLNLAVDLVRALGPDIIVAASVHTDVLHLALTAYNMQLSMRHCARCTVVMFAAKEWLWARSSRLPSENALNVALLVVAQHKEATCMYIVMPQYMWTRGCHTVALGKVRPA
jgi:hypothetical protein